MKFSLFSAAANHAAVDALFTAAGLDLEQMLALKDPAALAAHIESVRVAAAQGAPAITAETPAVAALIAAAVEAKATEITAAHATAAALHSAFASGLAAAGIAPKAADAAKGVQATDVSAAINDRVQIAAQEQLAKRGLAQFPVAAPVADPTTPKAPAALKGLARTEAAYAAKLAASGGRRI
jgi:hypothetical protein